MPRVAALLDVAQISEIVAVESTDTFVRPIYAGNVLATVRSADSVKVITVRGTGFGAAAAEGGYRPDRDDPAGRQDQRLPLREPELTRSERPELSGARRVVSGGRGMGSGETSSCWRRLLTSSERPWGLACRGRRGLRPQ